LSRALNDLGLHVLALDSDQNQTSGAERWKAKEAARRQKQLKKGKGARSLPNSTLHCTAPPSALFRSHVYSWPSASVTDKNDRTTHSHMGSLTHQTICINPHTLESSIHDWLLSGEANQMARSVIGELHDGIERHAPQVKPVPVMMVALHACGSLTPDILRAFLSNHRRPSASDVRVWAAQALVVVGCCYNLMVPEGEPQFLWLIPPHVCYSCTGRFSVVSVTSSANTSSDPASCLSPPCCADPISMAP